MHHVIYTIFINIVSYKRNDEEYEAKQEKRLKSNKSQLHWYFTINGFICFHMRDILLLLLLRFNNFIQELYAVFSLHILYNIQLKVNGIHIDTNTTHKTIINISKQVLDAVYLLKIAF